MFVWLLLFSAPLDCGAFDVMAFRSIEERHEYIDSLAGEDLYGTISRLSEVLGCPSEQTRMFAAEALGYLSDPGATPALSAALKSPSTGVRYETAWALGLLGDTSAVTPLIEALSDCAAPV